jgi:hypothetical protein
VADQGTHTELLARSPGYADLVNAYDDSPEDPESAAEAPGAARPVVTP